MEENYSSELLRFVQDLEFVQLLANPNYLQYLSNKGYLEDNDFIKYLVYLNYLKKPDFSRFIVYTRCFVMLDLLLNETFRKELSNTSFINYLHDVIHHDWSLTNIVNKYN